MLLLRWLVLATLIATGRTRVVVTATNDTYEDRAAAFGPKPAEIDGILVAAESLPSAENATIFPEFSAKGCVVVEPPPHLPPNASWIALVERGECSFVEKVRAMMRSGAAAVVVGDNEKNSGLITMYASGDASDISIPSVFIMQWAYRDLRYLTTNHWRITGQQRIDSDDDWLRIRIERINEFRWPLLDIIIVTVVAPAVILVFLYSLWRFRRHRMAMEADADATTFPFLSHQHPQPLLTEEELDNLPVASFEHAEADMFKYSNTCAICLDDFQPTEQIRLLVRCQHAFHVECIDPWLTTKKRTCPVCKTEAWPMPGTSSSSSAGAFVDQPSADGILLSPSSPPSPIRIPHSATSGNLAETSPLLGTFSSPHNNETATPVFPGMSSSSRLIPPRRTSLPGSTNANGPSRSLPNHLYVSIPASDSSSYPQQPAASSASRPPRWNRTPRLSSTHHQQSRSVSGPLASNAGSVDPRVAAVSMLRWFGTPSSRQNHTPHY